MTKYACETDGCTKAVRARGFCTTCYYRNLRQGKIAVHTESKRWKHRLSNIDEANKTATCQACGEVKIIKRDKRTWRCSVPSNDRSRDYKRAYRQSRKNQLTDACEICGSNENLRWDHDHDTGIFRGTLCNHCNLAIGLLRDSHDLCAKAAEYLKTKKIKNI